MSIVHGPSWYIVPVFCCSSASLKKKKKFQDTSLFTTSSSNNGGVHILNLSSCLFFFFVFFPCCKYTSALPLREAEPLLFREDECGMKRDLLSSWWYSGTYVAHHRSEPESRRNVQMTWSNWRSVKPWSSNKVFMFGCFMLCLDLETRGMRYLSRLCCCCAELNMEGLNTSSSSKRVLCSWATLMELECL